MITLVTRTSPIPEHLIRAFWDAQERIEALLTREAEARERVRSVNSPLAEQVFGFSSREFGNAI